MMTTNEKITLVMSAIALVISTSMSVIQCKWYNDYEIAREYRPQLRYLTVEHSTKGGFQIEVTLENYGKTAAHNISLNYQPIADYILLPDEPVLTMRPPCLYETSSLTNSLTISLARALGPGEKQQIVLSGIITPEVGGKGLIITSVFDDIGEAQHYHSAELVDKDVFNFK